MDKNVSSGLYGSHLKTQVVMLLAGDVGGTKVRLALFEEKGGTHCIDEQKFSSHAFPNLSALLKTFLADEGGKKITAVSLGIAGPVKDGVCRATNLPWEISAEELKKDLKISKVYLINDLQANAWGLRCLSPEEFFTVNQGEASLGNQALISVGTGLGEAGLYWDGKTHLPFPSEGGHCDFGPTSEEEVQLLYYLKKQHKHVSYERVLSGSGLYQLYRFFIDTHLEKEDPAILALMEQGEPQRVITERGLSNGCGACARACRLFVKILAAESSNVALKFLALNGVFIGGGIPPHLLPLIKERSFFDAFLDKGRFSTLLSKIPIKIILNEKTALLGAAKYAQVISRVGRDATCARQSESLS